METTTAKVEKRVVDGVEQHRFVSDWISGEIAEETVAEACQRLIIEMRAARNLPTGE